MLRAPALASEDAINSLSSVILWSAVSPPFRMHDVPTTYGLKVFIQSDDTKPRRARNARPRDSAAAGNRCRPDS